MFIHEYRKIEDAGEFVCLNTVQSYRKSTGLRLDFKKRQICCWATLPFTETYQQKIWPNNLVLSTECYKSQGNLIPNYIRIRKKERTKSNPRLSLKLFVLDTGLSVYSIYGAISHVYTHLSSQNIFSCLSVNQANAKAEFFLPGVNTRIRLFGKLQQVLFFNYWQ